jgi:hypothetical protein
MKLVSFALLSFLLLVVSCGESPKTGPSASGAPRANSEARQSDSSERVIQLTPEALAQAHIVWEEVSPHSIPQTLRAPGRITVNENRVWRVGTIAESRSPRRTGRLRRGKDQPRHSPNTPYFSVSTSRARKAPLRSQGRLRAAGPTGGVGVTRRRGDDREREVRAGALPHPP